MLHRLSGRADEQVGVGAPLARQAESDVGRAQRGLASEVDRQRVDQAVAVEFGETATGARGLQRQPESHVAAQPERHAADDALAAQLRVAHGVGDDLPARVGRQVEEAAQLPGLEAVQRREGDLIVQGSQPLPVIGEGTNCIIGTSQLLEPPVGFRPEQVVHVQSDNPVGYIEHWPHELDMLARLVSLYEPDGNDPAWIVSERLPELLGERLEPGDVAKRYAQEIGLRRLALLPPFGLVYRFRLFARDFTTAQQLRKELGDELKGMDGTSVLRLGRPVALSGSVRLSGYFVNDELEPDALQQLRWRLFERGGTLSIQPVRGPWH